MEYNQQEISLTSESLDTITEALSKAQSEFEDISKNDIAQGKFNYKYANLADCLVEIRKVLSKHGIAFTQIVHQKSLYTTIYHGNQWIRSIHPIDFNLPNNSNPVQDYGKILTYMRRYAIMGIVGIAGKEDDNDGNLKQQKASFSSVDEFHKLIGLLYMLDEKDIDIKEKLQELTSIWKKYYANTIDKMESEHINMLTSYKDKLKKKYAIKKTDALLEALNNKKEEEKNEIEG